jgi:hypothetical protein
VDLDAHLHQGADVPPIGAVRRQVIIRSDRVGQDAYVYAPLDGPPERRFQLGGGDQVGRDQPDLLPGGVDGVDQLAADLDRCLVRVVGRFIRRLVQ